jgi:hypothetical protein
MKKAAESTLALLTPWSMHSFSALRIGPVVYGTS